MLQSILHPAAGQAQSLANWWWVMFWVLLAVFVLTMALLGRALMGRRRPGPGMGLVKLGVGFTVLVLGGLLAASSLIVVRPLSPEGEVPVRVEVVGRQWWWEVRYPQSGAVLANEIRLPAGRPAEIALSTADVIHSFWVPALGGKVDMVPGHSNLLAVTPALPGIYRGQCAEFCGTQHALMGLVVVVEAAEDFESWLARQAAPAQEPVTDLERQGRALFLSSGCGVCHTVRGTDADGQAGPDLTHLGGRLTIGAGILPQNVGTIGGWVANSQAIKPGNPMPPFASFDGVQLRAIATWLAGLQ